MDVPAGTRHDISLDSARPGLIMLAHDGYTSHEDRLMTENRRVRTTPRNVPNHRQSHRQYGGWNYTIPAGIE